MVYMSEVSTYLEQSGVKGMKWGVRKQESTGTTSRGSMRTEDSIKAHEHKRRAREHGVSSLSNKDLQEFITRANLEQQFSKMSQSKKAVGAKRTKELLSSIGMSTVRSILGGVLTDAVKTMLGLNKEKVVKNIVRVPISR